MTITARIYLEGELAEEALAVTATTPEHAIRRYLDNECVDLADGETFSAFANGIEYKVRVNISTTYTVTRVRGVK